MSVLRAAPRGHHPPPQETAPSSTFLSHPGVGEAGFFSSSPLLSNSYADRSNAKNITSFSENTLIKGLFLSSEKETRGGTQALKMDL